MCTAPTARKRPRPGHACRNTECRTAVTKECGSRGHIGNITAWCMHGAQNRHYAALFLRTKQPLFWRHGLGGRGHSVTTEGRAVQRRLCC